MRRCTRSRATWAGLAVAMALAGCSTYEPVTSPAPRAPVRARLTVAEAVRWSELYGEPVRTIQGRVVRQDEEGLHLDVLLVRSSSQFRTGEFRDTLVIPASGLESLAERRFSAWRTAVVGAGLVGAVYLIIDQVIAGGGGDENPRGGNPPPQSRLPLLQIPIGR